MILNNIWPYLLIITILFSLGIYYFIKVRKDPLFKKLIKRFLPILIIFPLLDMISTIIFVSALGYQYESNLLGRALIANFTPFSYPIMFFISFLCWYSVICCGFFHLERKSRKEVANWIYYLVGSITGLYIFIVIVNLRSLFIF